MDKKEYLLNLILESKQTIELYDLAKEFEGKGYPYMLILKEIARRERA